MTKLISILDFQEVEILKEFYTNLFFWYYKNFFLQKKDFKIKY
jgi:hypothetical protein